METLIAIKPGPKPLTQRDGTLDERRRVTPPNHSKYPPLREHNHKPGDSKKKK